MSIERYSIIEDKNPREIVLLKSRQCQWGLCTFCDYIHDNYNDQIQNAKLNQQVLERVTGIHKQLEVINSGSCIELPDATLTDIQTCVNTNKIEKLYFESHYKFKNLLKPFSERFSVPIIYKTGIETFDEHFRNKVLRKGVYFNDPSDVAKDFKSICLLIGIKGQTREMIQRDIEILLQHFDYGCINIFQNNTTEIKADLDLIEWFYHAYRELEKEKHIEILWHNTDFGVGGERNESKY